VAEETATAGAGLAGPIGAVAVAGLFVGNELGHSAVGDAVGDFLAPLFNQYTDEDESGRPLPLPSGPPLPPNPPKATATAPCPDGKGGENEHTARGKEAHKWKEYGEGYDKNFRFKNGDRPDAINQQARHIKELKPSNPEKMGEYMKQLQRYLKQAEQEFPTQPGQKPWSGEIIHY
jgi:hypothetical protein